MDRQLFDYLGDPDRILQAMADHSFDSMLEHYYKSGKDDKEETT